MSAAAPSRLSVRFRTDLILTLFWSTSAANVSATAAGRERDGRPTIAAGFGGHAPLTLRFGPEIGRQLDQMFGRAAEPIDPIRIAELIGVARLFAEPIGAAAATHRGDHSRADGLTHFKSVWTCRVAAEQVFSCRK